LLQKVYNIYQREHIEELYAKIEDAEENERQMKDEYNSELTLAQTQIQELNVQMQKRLDESSGLAFKRLQEMSLELERLRKKKSYRKPSYLVPRLSKSHKKSPLDKLGLGPRAKYMVRALQFTSPISDPSSKA
jgi:hypothetical protein